MSYSECMLYINSNNEKVCETPGYNWSRSGDFVDSINPVLPLTNNTPLIFDDGVKIYQKNLEYYDGIYLRVSKDGFYNMNYNIRYGNDTDTDEQRISVFLFLNRPGQFTNLPLYSTSCVSYQDSQLNVWTLQLDSCVYLRQDDQVYIQISNDSNVKPITIFPSSALIINKIY